MCEIKTWLAEAIPTDVRQAIDRLSRCDDVCHIAVMPDVHLAEQVCVGVVMATQHLIYPDAVGGDIGCGMSAVAIDGSAGLLRRESTAIGLLHALRRAVPTARRGGASLLEMPPELAPELLSQSHLQNAAAHNGRYQFATLGSGNHFVELLADEHNQLWLMVHSGSRCMGPAIRQAHRGEGSLPSLEADSPEGAAYLCDAAWAQRYAAANRLAILRCSAHAVNEVLNAGMVSSTFVDCCHNHVRREVHLGSEYWVHRKGAAPAGAGIAGIIPGSMGTASYLVEGKGHPPSLSSSSHGAGRRLSRSAARATITRRDLERQLGDVWYDAALGNALREEAPKAYRDIRKVMRAQSDLVRITRQLRPLLSYKGI